MKPNHDRPDRRTRYAQGPAPVPNPAPSAAPRVEPPAPPKPPEGPRKHRSTVIGSPTVRSGGGANESAKAATATKSGRHKTLTDTKGKLPAALRSTAPPAPPPRGESQTVVGPPPAPPTPAAVREDFEFDFHDDDEDDEAPTLPPPSRTPPPRTPASAAAAAAPSPAPRVERTVVGPAPAPPTDRTKPAPPARIDSTVPAPGSGPSPVPPVGSGSIAAGAPAAAIDDRGASDPNAAASGASGRIPTAPSAPSASGSGAAISHSGSSTSGRIATMPNTAGSPNEAAAASVSAPRPVDSGVMGHSGPQPVVPQDGALPLDSVPIRTEGGRGAPAQTRMQLPQSGDDSGAPSGRDNRLGTYLHGMQGLVDAGSDAPKLRLTPGRVIPGTRYKILRWLGEGGMGVVYEATHVDIERKSALKILRFDLSKQPRMVQVFRDEARAASRLGAPNIVEIFDFGELPDGRLFFAMELLEGHDLVPTEDMPVIESGRLIGILRQVCKGLAKAHDAGVVHRDVKPENLILGTHEERPDVVKIVDFGISAMLAAGQDQGGGGIAGTPHYMAPEQILGDRFDGRLDVYALGATAYELLTGQPPFDAEEVEEILQMQVSSTPTPPRAVRPELNIPAEVESVILKCLAKEPAQRYPNMAELEAALCEAQIAAGLTTPWDDLAVPELPDPERRAQIVARMPNAVAAESRKRSLLWPIVAGASTLAAAGLAGFLLFGNKPTEQEANIVEELASAAREAAADNSWVIPPPHRAESPTAYQKVLELEDVEGAAEDLADDRAEELRERFATTLVGNGDSLWDRGFQSVARDYYLWALMFDDDNDHAMSRVDVSMGMIASFKEKARNGEFGDVEMALAGVAAARVEQDPDKKKALEESAAEAASKAEMSGMQAAAFDQAAKGTNVEKELARKRPPRGSGVVPPPEEDAAPEVPEEGVDAGLEEEIAIEDDAGTEPEVSAGNGGSARPRQRRRTQDQGALLGKAKRDPERSKELTAEGKAALKAGKRQQAASLFNQAISFDRGNAAALMGLSDVYFDTGSNQKAVNYAEKAVKAAPNNKNYRLKLGDAYFKTLRYQDARTQYDHAKRLGHGRAAERLAKVDAKLGK